jgi:hypothetical protein
MTERNYTSCSLRQLIQIWIWCGTALLLLIGCKTGPVRANLSDPDGYDATVLGRTDQSLQNWTSVRMIISGGPHSGKYQYYYEDPGFHQDFSHTTGYLSLYSRQPETGSEVSSIRISLPDGHAAYKGTHKFDALIYFENKVSGSRIIYRIVPTAYYSEENYLISSDGSKGWLRMENLPDHSLQITLKGRTSGGVWVAAILSCSTRTEKENQSLTKK